MWYNFISNSIKPWYVYISSLYYIAPSLICAVYAFQIRKLRENAERLRLIWVHIPGVFALVGILGWIIYFVIELVILIYLKYKIGLEIAFILISSASSTMFVSMLAFTIIFFTLETLNRNLILPHFYPNGGLSSTKRMSISSIRNLFLFYFFSAAFFPFAYLGIRLFMSIRYGLEGHYSDLVVAMILLLIGLILTFILSGFFSKPLKRLSLAADSISEGNYDIQSKICSNDELGLLGDSFNSMAQSLKEKEFMRDTFGKVVTPQVRDYLLGGIVALGGETISVTVMFCDIRGFTTLSENMEPEKIVSLLNADFTELEKCITSHGGVINKYIGDAIMALFGAPVRLENHAREAFLAALDMRQALENMNKTFASRLWPEIRFGIGLHTGNVLAGNIGAASRMEYTVIGDTVNTASRIEGLCKTYKTDLLLSENTASALKETNQKDITFNSLPTQSDAFLQGGESNSKSPISLVFVDDAEIRGRTEKVKIYTA